MSYVLNSFIFEESTIHFTLFSVWHHGRIWLCSHKTPPSRSRLAIYEISVRAETWHFIIWGFGVESMRHITMPRTCSLREIKFRVCNQIRPWCQTLNNVKWSVDSHTVLVVSQYARRRWVNPFTSLILERNWICSELITKGSGSWYSNVANLLRIENVSETRQNRWKQYLHKILI